MKKIIGFLLAVCLGLGTAGAWAAEENGSGVWYMVYAGVTIGDLTLNEDGTFALAVYAQGEGNTGTWIRDGQVITLSYVDGTREYYILDGTELIPAGNFTIRRESGRMTSIQLSEYDQYGTLPEGVSGEEAAAIVNTILAASAVNQQPEPEPEPEPEQKPETVYSPMFSGEETFDTVTPAYARGFSVPVVIGWGEPAQAEDKAQSTIQYVYDAERFVCQETCTFVELDSFPDPAEHCQAIRESLLNAGTYPDLEEQQLDIGGFPAYAICFSTDNEGETAGIVYVVRENTVGAAAVVCGAKEGNPVRVTLNDMAKIAEQMTFDPEKAPLRKADGELTLTLKGNPEAIAAGKKVTFTATFANQNAVNKAKAGALVWDVADRETREKPEGITVNEKGVLSASADLTENQHVVVFAVSEIFGTMAAYELTVVPVIRKLAADQGEVVLYTDSEDEAVVTVRAEPDIALEGLAWTLKPNTLGEVVPGEGGTAVIRALAAGKGTLTAKEPGGKTVTMKVTVMRPVQSMTLSMSGSALPGKEVRLSAAIKPENAGNRKVQWSLDVGDEIATINEYGRLKIKKDAPAGTVITVTCTAPGAKVPVVETMEVVVGE